MNESLKKFYDNKYYEGVVTGAKVSLHLRRLSKKLPINRNQHVLDVACGTGEWVSAINTPQRKVVGIDLAYKAIQVARTRMPDGGFCVGNAERLPFSSEQFDVVSCLGALEHFANIESGLREMVRIAKNDAKLLFLVPNSDFLTSKLGIYHGTIQSEVKEETKSIRDWVKLFEQAGLHVERYWRDLHILSWSWISRRGWIRVPLRAVQAIALLFWPLKWQYQVYFLCERAN